MSAILPATAICERALRAIGAFPITDSAADGEQLREAMIWLDLILAENAGTNKLFFLVPATVSFALQNGVGKYDLIAVLGQNAPQDGVQFTLGAYLVSPQSVIGYSGTLPTGIITGLVVSDVTNPGAIPSGTTCTAIDTVNRLITLSNTVGVVAGDIVSFAATPSAVTLASTGVNVTDREEIPIVKRDVFMSRRNPSDNGPPCIAYIDRLPATQIYFHPFPGASDPNQYTIELDVQTYAPNVAPAGVTGTQPQAEELTKFRQAWQRFLVFQLAHDLGSGPIFKLPEASLNRFAGSAALAKGLLEGFENREHEDTPPIGEANECFHDHDPYYWDRVRRY